MPRAVSIVHIPRHQKGDSPTARGNCATDLAAQKVADKDFITPVLAIGLPPPGMETLPPTPEYSSTDLAWIQEHTNFQKGEDGWYQDSDGYLILSAQLGRQLCEHLHLSTHLRKKKTLMLFQTARLRFPQHQTTVKNIVHACTACQQMRPGKGQHAGLRYRGEGPGQHWE